MTSGRHLSMRSVLVLCGVGALAVGASTPALAQSLQVPLVRQDFSDCANGNVTDPGGLLTSGTLSLVRNGNGTTSISVAMTVNPDTTYHFFLKCVTLLGDIKTDDEGIGEAAFTFPTNSVGGVYGFDMYPEGAPAGNKFQSVQVRFQ